MSVQSVTHLNFRNNAKDALQFYHSIFGGSITIVTYQDANNVENLAEAEQVMWGQVLADNGFSIMAYDVPSSRPFERGIGSFFVSVRGNSESELRSFWRGLEVEGQVVVELGPTAWAPAYGMVIDRFGITWVLDIVAPWAGN